MIFFKEKLREFYKQSGRTHLPWRQENITAYQVWVSEIMLQQTQVNRVIDYYQRFLKRFPNVFTLAESSWEEFLPYYTGLGYYRRGQNMLLTAQIVAQEHQGEFPKNKEQLTRLPGIGEYTATAILSFAYEQNCLAFDTNLQRVFGRYLAGDKRAILDKEEIESHFSENSKIYNGAIMDFANQICLNTPKCHECPLNEKCHYYLEDGCNEVKAIKKKSNFPTTTAQVYLWLHKEHREYYSPNPDRFEVFKLPVGINSREQIKKYFRDNHSLELAVRPPHRKIFIDEKPILFINAQILLGEHEFGRFEKNQIEMEFSEI